MKVFFQADGKVENESPGVQWDAALSSESSP